MSSFRIVEHVVRTQHSRERFAGADLDGEQHLRFHVKQYIPRSNPTPRPGDVTIIGGVAAAFPKECMEPLWEDLCEKLHERGRQVRAIWIADPVNQGQSGVMNEKLLGPDPSWWDHGRDLLFLINQFQDEMPHPLVGVGHSMGAGHLTHLALLHPRLLHALVLMDVVFSTETVGTNWAAASLKRRDLWPSRDAAESSINSNPVFKKFDHRALAQYLRHGLRELPSEQYPDMEVADSTSGNKRPVTLQTTKAQEIYNCVRLTVPDDRYLLQEDDLSFENSHFDDPQDSGAFNRSENLGLYRKLPELRPSTLYLVGSKSEVSTPELRAERLSRTGTGLGGSGGMARGRVKETVLDCGHLVPFERTTDSAEACATFLNAELGRWQKEDTSRRRRWQILEGPQRVDVNDVWRSHLTEVKKKMAQKL